MYVLPISLFRLSTERMFSTTRYHTSYIETASLTSLYTGLKFKISFFPHRIPGEECDTLLTHNSTVSKVTVNNDLIWETIVILLIGLKFTFFCP